MRSVNDGKAAEGSKVSEHAEAAKGIEGVEVHHAAEAASAAEGSESLQNAAHGKGKISRWWSSKSPGHVSWAPASDVGINWLSHAGAEPLQLPG